MTSKTIPVLFSRTTFGQKDFFKKNIFLFDNVRGWNYIYTRSNDPEVRRIRFALTTRVKTLTERFFE